MKELLSAILLFSLLIQAVYISGLISDYYSPSVFRPYKSRAFCEWKPDNPLEMIGASLSYPSRKIACFLTLEFKNDKD